jgi:hypothetical protein
MEPIGVQIAKEQKHIKKKTMSILTLSMSI